jgi:hypothetical protein
MMFGSFTFCFAIYNLLEVKPKDDENARLTIMNLTFKKIEEYL